MTSPKLTSVPPDPEAPRPTQTRRTARPGLSGWPTGPGASPPSMGEIGLNQFAPYLLNRFVADWNADLAGVLRGLGVTTTQFRALSVLAVASGITVNDLAVYAVTEQSTMSRTLDGLEEQGFIRRKPKSDDMRAREVYITEEGLALFAGLWPQVYRLYADAFAGLDEGEFRGFVATLQKLMRGR